MLYQFIVWPTSGALEPAARNRHPSSRLKARVRNRRKTKESVMTLVKTFLGQVQSSSYRLRTNYNFVYTDLNVHFKTSSLFFNPFINSKGNQNCTYFWSSFNILNRFQDWLIDRFICCFTSHSETLHPDLASWASKLIFTFSSVFVHDKYEVFLNI